MRRLRPTLINNRNSAIKALCLVVISKLATRNCQPDHDGKLMSEMKRRKKHIHIIMMMAMLFLMLMFTPTAATIGDALSVEGPEERFEDGVD